MSQLIQNNSSNNQSSQQCDVIQLLSISDLWLHHFLPFLTFHDVGGCEQVTRCFDRERTWQLLCERDFELKTREAPDASFQTISENYQTWKQIYQRWLDWHVHTHHVTTTQQGIDAIRLYQEIQAYCAQQQHYALKESFAPALDTATLQQWARHPNVPSDLVAWYAVCGGQRVLSPSYSDEQFWAAFLGCYTCYNGCYAMRLVDAKAIGPTNMHSSSQATRFNQHIMVALCIANPRLCISVRKDPIHDSYGRLVRMHPFGQDDTNSPIVGDQGILQYFQGYVNNLMNGIFPTVSMLPEEPQARGIVPFPEAGDAVSVCVTNGVEVRASARWFPTFSSNDTQQQQDEEEGLNFGYSIRIRMVDASIASTCQLVSRHWKFVNGYGKVRLVDGEAVVGKQPLFFFRDDQSFGYHDLGSAGGGATFMNTVFAYQSQSGPVAGTTRQDTHGAHARGYFRFVPGSLEEPKGPPFNVTVARFPFVVSFPFY